MRLLKIILFSLLVGSVLVAHSADRANKKSSAKPSASTRAVSAEAETAGWFAYTKVSASMAAAGGGDKRLLQCVFTNKVFPVQIPDGNYYPVLTRMRQEHIKFLEVKYPEFFRPGNRSNISWDESYMINGTEQSLNEIRKKDWERCVFEHERSPSGVLPPIELDSGFNFSN